MNGCFLDTHVSTPLARCVREKLQLFLNQRFEYNSTPSSLIELVGAHADDTFIFCSSGAEAINQVIFSTYVDVTRTTGKNHFIASAHESKATLLSMSRLQDLGCIFQRASVHTNGQTLVDHIAETLSPRTALISVSYANTLTGVINPIEAIAELCRERGVLLHVDASALLGKGYETFKECGADFLTFDGALLGAPASTGGIFIRKTRELSPLIFGKRPDPLGLMSLETAALNALESRDSFVIESSYLRNHLEELLMAKLPLLQIPFQDTPRLPHISTLIFPGIKSELLHFLLKRRAIHTSFGTDTLESLSDLLQACCLDPPDAFCGLSFGLSSETTLEEIEAAASKIVEVVQQIQHYGERFATL